MTGPEAAEIIAWDGFTLDMGCMEVRRGAETLELEPKSIRVLEYLIRNRDRAVPKEELMTAVWTDTFVTDNAIARVIAQIRKQLGDNARNPQYIETVATIGYRFIAEAQILAKPVPGVVVPVVVPAPEKRKAWRYLAGVFLVVVLAVGAWKFNHFWEGPIQLGQLRPLTTTSATEFWPSFSPDGSQVAFSSNRSGSFEIYIASLASGSTERALTRDGLENFQPAWSPDGQAVAYVSRKRRGIWMMPVSGGIARQITNHGDSPAWSPDGKYLTFRDGALDMNPGLETSQVPGTTIWVVDVDGANARPLTKREGPPGAHNYPRWTPDGRHVLFATMVTAPFSQLQALPEGRKQHANVFSSAPWMVEVDTGKLEPIEIDAPLVRSPVLSPDGRHLYYVGAGTGQPGVWHARMNGFRAGKPEALLPGGGMVARDLFLSPDGKRIAFGQQTGESALWSVSMAPDGAPKAGPEPILRNRSYRNAEAVFSPDGLRLAYSSVLQGGEAVIMLAGADGANPTAITHPEDLSGRPSWRGTDGTLGYRAYHNGEWSYFLMRPGGQKEKLNLAMDVRNGDRMRFSPDGRQIAAHINTPAGTQVVVEDVETRTVRRMTPDSANYSFPVWSPDGRWIGMQTRAEGKMQLALLPAGGGPIRILNTGKAQSMAHDWAPDSSRIAFAGLADDVWNIFWIAIDSGRVQQLTHFTSRSAFVRYPAWSPQGDRIVFENNNISSNIYVADLKP